MTILASEKARIIYSELTAAFRLSSNPESAKMQEAYMKYKMPYWGIASNPVKQIANSVFKEHLPVDNIEYRDILWYLFTNGNRREEWYAAMFMALKFKIFITATNVDLYLDIVLKSQWWDIVDTTASNLIGPALSGGNLRKWLIPWVKHENMWVRRAALLTQLKYKDMTDFELLKDLILHTDHESDFFIRKAIGWALRQYSYTNPEAVIELIEKRRDYLSNLSICEAQKGLIRMGYIK